MPEQHDYYDHFTVPGAPRAEPSAGTPLAPGYSTAPPPPTPSYGFAKEALTDLQLPGGGLVQVRRPGVAGLARAGVVQDLDALTGMVGSVTIPTAEGRPSTGDHLARRDAASTPGASPAVDVAQVMRAMDVMDRVVQYVVVQPLLLTPPTGDGQRDPGAYYLDDMDVDDKAFVTQFVMGGSRDLERFRAQSAAAVGGVPAGA